MRNTPLQSRVTPLGEQTLVPGVKPITVRDRLQALMDGPLLPRHAQKPCNLGLFDNGARNQLDLFIHTRSQATSHDQRPRRLTA